MFLILYNATLNYIIPYVYNGHLEMNCNKKQGFRIIAEHIEQILIQNTSTLPEKGTFRNERPKTADNAIVESQTTGPGEFDGEFTKIVTH